MDAVRLVVSWSMPSLHDELCPSLIVIQDKPFFMVVFHPTPAPDFLLQDENLIESNNTLGVKMESVPRDSS